ncbi:hypothetical protein JXB22_11060, partial [candidate division WOR-3 bacterium]|nr:hypothetical protein [candidate division WOR-3 bacterium]
NFIQYLYFVKRQFGTDERFPSNTESEALNPKQIRNPNFRNTKIQNSRVSTGSRPDRSDAGCKNLICWCTDILHADILVLWVSLDDNSGFLVYFVGFLEHFYLNSRICLEFR